MKRRRRKRRERIRMFLLLIVVATTVLMLTAAAGRSDDGECMEGRSEVGKFEQIPSCTQTVHTMTGAAEPEQEKEFEEWVKPHIEGMVPVYGREGIDYISFEDFDKIAKIVYAEAKTESFDGKVAVAEVVLNRVESDNFPNTVEEVITQESAFSAYGASGDAPLDTECMEAVQEAVNGRIFPSGVVYFREGHYHTFGEPYTVIGNHYFSTE